MARRAVVLSTTLAGYAVAAVAAYGAFLWHLPLAWMLGAMFAAAFMSMLGVQLRPHRSLRYFALTCIGTSAGLNVTASMFRELLGWLPIMIVTALVSMLFSTIVAAFLSKATRIDLKTSFFACMPGGLSEMGNIGFRMGARVEPIAVVQTLRITLIVMVLPPLLISFGIVGHAAPPSTETVSLQWLAILLLGAGATAFLLGAIRLNNPWPVGAVMFAGTIASLELVVGHIPVSLSYLAQFLMGFSVGSQFRRDMFKHLPLVSLCGAVSVVVLASLAAMMSLTISTLTGIDLVTMILATSPGGLSEMMVTAQALHLVVPLVVSFQIVRTILVNGFAGHYYNLFERIGFFDVLQRWIIKGN